MLERELYRQEVRALIWKHAWVFQEYLSLWPLIVHTKVLERELLMYSTQLMIF
jgi:hypothetical protein